MKIRELQISSDDILQKFRDHGPKLFSMLNLAEGNGLNVLSGVEGSINEAVDYAFMAFLLKPVQLEQTVIATCLKHDDEY